MTMVAAVLGTRLLAATMVHWMAMPGSIAVEVDAAVVDGDALAARLAAGVEPLAYLLPAAATPVPVARVRVTGELLDFHVGLALDGAARTTSTTSTASTTSTMSTASTTSTTSTMSTTATWSRCACTHAELVSHVQRRVALALRPRPVRPPPPRAIAPPPPPAAPPVVLARRGLGHAGRLGVGLVGLGGLVLGAGAGAMAAVALAQDERWRPRTNVRPAGLAAMASGTGALATGALLLLLDRRLTRARRRTAPP